MKAERRHELKENALAKNLEAAPAFFQQHGSKVLLGLIVCLLVYILVNNHYVAKADKLKHSKEDIGNALYALAELRRLGIGVSVERLAEERRKDAALAAQAVADLLERSDDPKFRAEALIARGDTNWQLAQFPPLPGSETRPTELNLDKSHEDLIKAAEDAYKEVLTPPLNEDAFASMRARFGLAYIAEDRGQWDAASQAFQKIADDPSTSKADKTLAQSSLELIPKLEKEPFIGTSAQSKLVIHPSAGSTVTPLGPTYLGPPAPNGESPIPLPSATAPAATQPGMSMTIPAITSVPSTQPASAAPTPGPFELIPPTPSVPAPTTSPLVPKLELKP